MLHRFGFADGSVSYANRFLESKAYRAAEETGEISYSEFATDPCRSLFKRAMSMFQPTLSDNGNVNLVKLGERFVTMTETPIPVEFDPETLATAGVAWDVPGTLTTAHPHLDRASGGMLNYAAKLGPRNEYRFFLLGPDAPPTEPGCSRLDAGQAARLHALVRADRALDRPRRVPLRRQPARAGALGPALHRELPLEAGARHALHPDRPGERRGERPVRDGAVLRLPPRQRLRGRGRRGRRRHLHLRRRRDRREPLPRQPPQRRGDAGADAGRRFTISPGGAARSSASASIDEPLDLPRIDYGRCNERPYRYVWGVGTDGSGYFDRIVARRPRARGRAGPGAEPGCYPGEPVFVAAPGRGRARADGVLLSLVLDGAAGNVVPARPRRDDPRGARRRPGCPTTSRSASTASTRRQA